MSGSRPLASSSLLLLVALTACGRAPLLAGSGSEEGGCAAPSMRCGERCVSPAFDPENCGSCGKRCATGWACVQGACALVCAGGATWCGERCVELASNPSHCGACDRRCAADDFCVAGACTPVCAAGLIHCDSGCVDPRSDPRHCGGCGKACANDLVCSGGTCRADCEAGVTRCGNSCVDTATDAANCGGCGKPCAKFWKCVQGACENPCGQAGTPCGNACVDLLTDGANCGGCGLACPMGNKCAGGKCQCPQGTTACGNACVDTLTDKAHCGGCNQACVGNCVNGQCQAQFGAIAGLGYRVVDAEYSKQLDRIVFVSVQPNELHIYDPVGRGDVKVALPTPPTAVSVGPDGLFAAVGHNAWVSHVDLAQGVVLKTHPVTCDVIDVVLAGNGWAYAFPRIDQWVDIHGLNLQTGKESLAAFIRAGTLAKLHPSGDSIYGANNGLSPSDIEKYDIRNGAPVRLYDSPYHGDFAMCGDLWMSEDGLRIFTRCGNVFKASPDKMQDMLYAGALAQSKYIGFVSHSAVAGKVAVIGKAGQFMNTTDTELQLYDYQFLNLASTTPLPKFVVNNVNHPSHGRFVFFQSDGKKIFVVVQADPAAKLLFDYGVATL